VNVVAEKGLVHEQVLCPYSEDLFHVDLRDTIDIELTSFMPLIIFEVVLLTANLVEVNIAEGNRHLSTSIRSAIYLIRCNILKENLDELPLLS
jgi:hypothetical protein